MVWSMRAMQLSRPGPASGNPLVGVDLATPHAGEGELLLRVAACGVCRTDLQIAEGDLEAHRLPVIPGHQAVGVIEEVGAGVSGWHAGERAGIAWLAGACGHCARCREGRENLCDEARFTGWDRDGGYATHVVVRADFALRLPESFSDLAAAPLLCGGVIGYRALKISGVEPGQRLGLFGFGASALLAMQVAKHWGCEIYVCTRSSGEQERARSLGAAWAGTYGERPPELLDAAITFAPAGAVVVAALEAIAPGAAVAINAIHLDGIPAFSYDKLWRERSLRSVANFTRQDARELLELAAKIPIETKTQIYDLADANRALADLREGRVSGAAVLRIESAPQRKPC